MNFLYIVTILLCFLILKKNTKLLENSKNKIIFFTISLFIFICFYMLKKKKSKESFDDSKYNTEIHFITFWTNDYNSKQRVINKINQYNNSNIRIIKKFKIKKENIKSLFKNVQSGGKNYKNNVEVFIIEVPSIYTIEKTHDNPDGESVNKYMYQLKIAARGIYTNYKIAHGSFNIKETNDFFIEYFKFLGDFKNFDEVLDELNNANVFWIYDRVTVEEYGEEAGDTDLIVDSIPATSFILRTTDINNKIFKKINGKKKLFDLQDFDSNYYPKKWLLEIKSNNKITQINNIKVPTKLDHFMLGLYHMYIHKNGIQNNTRINKLNQMAYDLGYNNIDFFIILEYLVYKNIDFERPKDKKVKYFLKSKGSNNIKGDGYSKKNIYFINNKYYYIYTNSNYYNKDKLILEKLRPYDITSKIFYYNDKLFLLCVDNLGDSLSKLSDTNLNNINFKDRINYINAILKKENILHNDINCNNLITKNNKLYLIDFEWATVKNNSFIDKNLFNQHNNYYDKLHYCRKLPDYKNENNFVDYLKNNKCLDY